MTKDNVDRHRQYLPLDYRKREVYVDVAAPGSTHNVDSYWECGSRDEFVLYRGNTRVTPKGNAPFCASMVPPLELLAGDILVRTGVFCGKTATAHVTYCK